MKRVLSIQSSVAFGHAGNSAAVFPMQRMGVDVINVHTVHFSNHTGYGRWRGPLLTPQDVDDVVRGVSERGALKNLDAVLTGYMGAETMGESILRAVDLVKEQSPHALYCCDPVMGDVGRGFFVREGIPEFFRDHIVSKADIVTPNHFELDFLVGGSPRTTREVIAAADEVRAQGPDIVLVTSVVTDEAEPDTTTMIAVNHEGAWKVTTRLLNRAYTGSGDLTAATFLTSFLQSEGDLAAALGRTADVVHGVLLATEEADSRELLLVAAQDELVQPTNHFHVQDLQFFVDQLR